MLNNMEVKKLKRELAEAREEIAKLTAKCRLATQEGYRKSDNALRMRAASIFELEMRVERASVTICDDLCMACTLA